MAKKKLPKKVKNTPKVDKKANLLKKIKWGESYTSLILGILVVIIATVLVFSLAKGRGMIGSGTSDSTTPTINQEKSSTKVYEVKPGDDLWAIAEKEYGSGYNWVDIAAENKLEDTENITEGTKLKIPNVKKRGADSEFIQPNKSQKKENSKAPEAETETDSITDGSVISNSNSITGKSYTVVEGDLLWDIAVRAYGDGYRWTEISEANNLVNPDSITSGQVIIIPR